MHTKPKIFHGDAAAHAKGMLLREQLECRSDLAGTVVSDGFRAVLR